jgi:hypothetical protein
VTSQSFSIGPESMLDIRDCERRADFVAVTRSTYRTNDERAAVKREINVAVGSELIEDKSYTAY